MNTKTILTRAVVFRFFLKKFRLCPITLGACCSRVVRARASEAAIFNNMVLFVYTKAGSLNVDNVWVSKN